MAEARFRPTWFLMSLVVLCCGCAQARTKRYNGYKVLRVGNNDVDRGRLEGIFSYYFLDIWRRASPVNSSYDVMVSPVDWAEVTTAFDNIGAKYSTLISDVQKLIDEERGSKKRRSRRSSRRFSLHRYHKWEEIRRWMFHFARAHNDIVKVIQVGISYEGRRILALKIGERSSTNITKRIIWQDGGIHAREWVTGATLIWLSRKLIRGYREGDPLMKEYLDRLDWYIVPVWNVDGYKYTWKKDRMWRKSRSERGSYGCFGVDLNRNFPTPNRGGGTSSENACSEVYHGPKTFSEIESQSVGNFLKTKRDHLAAVITLHSYAQLWLYPYGYQHKRSPDHDELQSLSAEAVSAMSKKHGTTYREGTVADLAYIVSGGSIDWSYETLCVKYTFAIELRDMGLHGFVLPPSQIVPTAEEYYGGLQVVARRVLRASDEDLRSSVCSENIKGIEMP